MKRLEDSDTGSEMWCLWWEDTSLRRTARDTLYSIQISHYFIGITTFPSWDEKVKKRFWLYLFHLKALPLDLHSSTPVPVISPIIWLHLKHTGFRWQNVLKYLQIFYSSSWSWARVGSQHLPGDLYSARPSLHFLPRNRDFCCWARVKIFADKDCS